MKQFYALDKATREIAYQSASLFMLKDAIKYDNRDEADFIFTEDTDMKYLSRVVYVDDQCIYNNKDFWMNSAADIIENYDEHTVLDFLGKPVDKVRFEVEYNSNSSRIAAIDGVAGEVDYNMEVANEMIALFKEECILTKFVGISLHTGAYRFIPRSEGRLPGARNRPVPYGRTQAEVHRHA